MSSSSLEHRLSMLARILGETRPLWQPAPFYHPQLPWESTFPELATALRALPLSDIERLTGDEAALRAWLARWIPPLADIEALLVVAEVERPLSPPTGRHAPQWQVPGRKWAQIERFAGAVLPQMPATIERIVDWCGGKAHLGRLLAMHSGHAVLLRERDLTLCAEAETLARRDRVRLEVEPGDVLESDALPANSQVVALHACGELHTHLLDLAGDQAISALALSPCCYHRTRQTTYAWRSQAGRASGLALTRDDLRLAVLESVTSSAREREQARVRQQGLLALLAWSAECGQPLPSAAGHSWQPALDASENLARLAAQRGLPAPDATQAAALWSQAAERLREVRAFELIRHAVRRPLEALLVIDMALGLQAQGYTVDVRSFCARAVTPRNFLVMARRRAG